MELLLFLFIVIIIDDQKVNHETLLSSLTDSPTRDKGKKYGINGFNNGKLPNTHYKLQLSKKRKIHEKSTFVLQATWIFKE